MPTAGGEMTLDEALEIAENILQGRIDEETWGEIYDPLSVYSVGDLEAALVLIREQRPPHCTACMRLMEPHEIGDESPAERACDRCAGLLNGDSDV